MSYMWTGVNDVLLSSGQQYVTTETWTDNSSWPSVTHTVVGAGKFKPTELEFVTGPLVLTEAFENIIDEQIKKGEDVMVYLSDLVIYFEMSKGDLDEIKKIMAEKDWKERLMVFLLAHAVVKEGLRFEHLGYEEKE